MAGNNFPSEQPSATLHVPRREVSIADRTIGGDCRRGWPLHFAPCQPAQFFFAAAPRFRVASEKGRLLGTKDSTSAGSDSLRHFLDTRWFSLAYS